MKRSMKWKMLFLGTLAAAFGVRAYHKRKTSDGSEDRDVEEDELSGLYEQAEQPAPFQAAP